jgi:hypothetical protein
MSDLHAVYHIIRAVQASKQGKAGLTDSPVTAFSDLIGSSDQGYHIHCSLKYACCSSGHVPVTSRLEFLETNS